MDELQGFRAIMDDYRNKIEGIQEPEIDRKLFEQATKEAEKDIKKLMKENFRLLFHHSGRKEIQILSSKDNWTARI